MLSGALLMPPGYAAVASGEGVRSGMLRFLSSAVIWAAQAGDLWHVLGFLILALLASRLVPNRSWRFAVGLFVSRNLYSLATEIVQEVWVPGRAFEWSDLAFNAAGITGGAVLGKAESRKQKAEMEAES